MEVAGLSSLEQLKILTTRSPYRLRIGTERLLLSCAHRLR
jgi:hypothetical protein